MNLLEHEGKRILRHVGIPIPTGYVAANLDEVATFAPQLSGERIVLKAQVPIGHRGKLGGVRICPKRHAVEYAAVMFGTRFEGYVCHEILLEELLHPKQELYLSVLVDRRARALRGVFCASGGVDIEQIALQQQAKVQMIKEQDVKSLEGPHAIQLRAILQGLFSLARERDALLIELNPLIVTPTTLIAADAKIVLDDNAAFRHKEMSSHPQQDLTELERRARDMDLLYVELDGDIGIIGCGAGMVMSSIDTLAHLNRKAANFLDIGGGASTEVMESALAIVLGNSRVRGVLINIFAGITKCDEIATGIIDYRLKHNVTLPFVVRMIGTNQDLGRSMLAQQGILALDSMDSCIYALINILDHPHGHPN